MDLTLGERTRLKKLRRWHNRPPTWGALLPKGIALVVAWCVLIVGFAIIREGVGSPLMYYCVGLASALPIFAFVTIITTVSGWRLKEAITNWDRVEELLAAKNGKP